MTDILDRPKMPEEKLPDLEPVYAELAGDFDAMDALDAIAFAHPKAVTINDIAAHCCPGVGRRTFEPDVSNRLGRVRTALRQHGMRLRPKKVADHGTHGSRYAYRLAEMCLAIAAVGGCLVAASLPAAAQANCKPREEIVKQLASQYQEQRRAYGLSKQMQVLELFAAESGTWTAIMSQPSGISCIIAVGEAWTEEATAPSGRSL